MRCMFENGAQTIRTAISKDVHDRMREVLPGPRFMGRFLSEVLEQYFEKYDEQGHGRGKKMQVAPRVW